MKNNPIAFSILLAGALCMLLLQNCSKKDEDIIIVTDDVLMLSRVADGLEGEACSNFVSKRSLILNAGDEVGVFWSEGKSLDTIIIVRLEVRSDTGSVAKFTMTLRPFNNKPSEIQCMKGFGCATPWEIFPWIVPGKNYLDQTEFKFRVIPTTINTLTVENYNSDKSYVLLVNPDF